MAVINYSIYLMNNGIEYAGPDNNINFVSIRATKPETVNSSTTVPVVDLPVSSFILKLNNLPLDPSEYNITPIIGSPGKYTITFDPLLTKLDVLSIVVNNKSPENVTLGVSNKLTIKFDTPFTFNNTTKNLEGEVNFKVDDPGYHSFNTVTVNGNPVTLSNPAIIENLTSIPDKTNSKIEAILIPPYLTPMVGPEGLNLPLKLTLVGTGADGNSNYSVSITDEPVNRLPADAEEPAPAPQV